MLMMIRTDVLCICREYVVTRRHTDADTPTSLARAGVRGVHRITSKKEYDFHSYVGPGAPHDSSALRADMKL